jgi:spermidine synthase
MQILNVPGDSFQREKVVTKLWLFLAGLFSLWGQVLLFRELLALFSGSELPIILGIGVLLLSSSLGLFSFKTSSSLRIRIFFTAFGASTVGLIVLAASLRQVFQTTRGMLLPLHLQLASLIIILVPYGFLAGRLFGEISFICLKEGGSVEKAYAIDTAGALAGGLCALSFIHFGFSQSFDALLLGSCAVSSSLISRKPLKNLILIPLFALSLAIQPSFQNFLLDIRRQEEPDLKEVKETPFGRLSVSSDGEQSALFLNGSLLYENQSTSAEELVHLPALCSGHLENVLLMGGSGEGLIGEILKHDPKKIDIVEQCAVFVELPEKYGSGKKLKNDPVCDIRYHFGDGRKFLEAAGRYDLIINAEGEPSSISGARFFTENFFENVRDHLTDKGIFAFRIGGSENLWSESLMRRNGSVIKPLFRIFKSVVVLPQDRTLVVASRSEIPALAELDQRWNDRNVMAKLASPAYFNYLMTNERRKKIERDLRNGTFEASTDDRPAAYPFTLVIELSRHFQGFSTFGNTVKWGVRAAVSLSVLLFVFAASRIGRNRSNNGLMVFFSGFWGMIYENALLVGYQVKNGALYKDIGLLAAFFMAGLSLGAVAAPFVQKKQAREIGLAIVSAIIVLSAGTPALLSISGASLPAVSLLASCSGLLAGTVFGSAQFKEGNREGGTLKRLYGADLAGGAAGSIAGALFFIPFLGISLTLLLSPLVFLPAVFSTIKPGRGETPAAQRGRV